MGETRPPCYDHRVHFFYDFSFESRDACAKLATIGLGDVAPPSWIHATRADATATRPILDKPVWEWPLWGVSLDLHPFVHTILDSNNGDSNGPQCLRLSTHGKILLSGRYRHAIGKHGHTGTAPPADGLLLSLSALSALALDQAYIPFGVEDAGIRLFGTGFGVAVLTIIIGRTAASLDHKILVEALPRLCDERSRQFVHWRGDGEKFDNAHPFSLGFAVEAMTGPAGCKLVARDRTYSFSALVFEDKLSDPEK